MRCGRRLGYLTKDAGADEIRQALQRVASGQASLDPAVQMPLVEAIATTATAATAPRHHGRHFCPDCLTAS